ncbi:MAG TPA: fasciclin domain-containing protein [Ilumatobacteraceae bacterium]|nr:fasciclin domain-containing protein [Ilumatobacteraceae bacterium]
MKRTSTRLVAVGAIAGLLALSACGSDSNDESSSTDAPAATDAMTETTEAMTETTEAMAETTEAMAEEPGTIVDVAVAAGTFNTLVAAVGAAELVDALSGEGPLTVFAPTDDAFAALPAGLVDCLLLPENKETLTTILTYHVVEGAVMSTDLTDGPVPTLQGEEITVDLTDGVTLNDSVTVVAADVAASNGVIHVIDGVLLPPTVAAGLDAFVATCPA